LDEQIEQAVLGFSSLQGVEPELAEKLVGEGFLSYDDLSVIEPDALMEMGSLSQEVVDQIVAQAEAKAAEAEAAAAEQRRKQREADRLAAAENVDEGTPDYLADADKSNGKPADGKAEADQPNPEAPPAGDEKNV